MTRLEVPYFRKSFPFQRIWASVVYWGERSRFRRVPLPVILFKIPPPYIRNTQLPKTTVQYICAMYNGSIGPRPVWGWIDRPVHNTVFKIELDGFVPHHGAIYLLSQTHPKGGFTQSASKGIWISSTDKYLYSKQMTLRIGFRH
jgi:hypothetical protein